MVNVNNLSAVPKDDSKMYVWEKSTKNMRHRKSEWQVKTFLILIRIQKCALNTDFVLCNCCLNYKEKNHICYVLLFIILFTTFLVFFIKLCPFFFLTYIKT